MWRQRLTELWTPAAQNQSAQVPILMYHSLTEDPSEVTSMTMTVDTFRAQMEALHQAGYTAISYDDLNRFCYGRRGTAGKAGYHHVDDGYAIT